MRTGWRLAKWVGVVVLCLVSLSFATDTTKHSQRKKKPELPVLPSGPTGPVPQVPLDSMKPVAPQVSYQNGQLTIVAPNSTLGDILRAVKKQTGADIDIPDAPERVVTHLGPGLARDVVADLLNGSRFNYVLLGSPDDASQLTRVVLVAKSGPETAKPANQPTQPAVAQAGQPAPEMAQDANDADQADDNAGDDNAEPAVVPAEAQEQPAGQPDDQNGPKTPQQMLQEMQQRQLRLQQQQPQGQAPIPGGGLPPGAQPPPQQQPQ